GAVEHGGVRLMLESARGRQNGERVLVLVRPEALEVEAANGAVADGNMLAGEVITHTFLGPVTRLKVVGTGSDLIADMPTARAATLPPGQKVVAKVPIGDARLLSLEIGRASCRERVSTSVVEESERK